MPDDPEIIALRVTVIGGQRYAEWCRASVRVRLRCPA
jgi:hypothetical protein